MDYIEIKDQIIFTLKNMLTEARFYHCLRVAEEAQRLASRWEKRRASYTLPVFYMIVLEIYPIRIDSSLPSYLGEEVYSIPAIFHALAGPAIVDREFGIKDYKIWHAIRWHATSCDMMSRFDKILFISDFVNLVENFLKQI